MRKQNSIRVEFHRSAEDATRRKQQMAAPALRNRFFGDHESLIVGEDGNHPLFLKLLHRCQQIGAQGTPICTERCPGQFLPHAVVHNSPNNQECVDPRLAFVRDRAQFDVRGLSDTPDRPESIKQPLGKQMRLAMERREQVGQVLFAVARTRLRCRNVPRPVRRIAIQTGQRSITA